MTNSLFNLTGIATLALAAASFLGATSSTQAGGDGAAKGKDNKACCKDDKCCADTAKCCPPANADKAKANDAAGKKATDKKADCCTTAKCC